MPRTDIYIYIYTVQLTITASQNMMSLGHNELAHGKREIDYVYDNAFYDNH